jgi:aminoglycoside phosphotransferase (APT) family kinase protein
MDDAAFARFRSWVERTLGGRVVHAERQGERRSGGRPAWFLDVARDGATQRCYARMERGPEHAIARAFTLEREHRVLTALNACGARVPRVYGYCADPCGILMERVAGEFDYSAAALDPAEREALGRDFLGELARLHALDPERFLAAGLEAPASAERCALHDLAVWEGAYRSHLRAPVPVVEFALGWLRRNVPPPPARLSLVQGDTGPGQFLFEGRHLRAIIDWEFAHLGDPMLDLAQIRTRDFYNPGIDLAKWLRTYAELSGRPVDLAKLRYYTVKSMLITPLALAGVVQNMPAQSDHAEWYAQDVCYKRATAEALAEAIGAELDPPALPKPTPGPRDAVFALLEENLHSEHRPALSEGFARARLDLSLRLLAHLRNADASAAALAADDAADLGELLGGSPRSGAEADAALVRAIETAGPERDAALVRYLHRRALREESLWRGALGVGEGAVFQRLGQIRELR